MVSSHFHPQHQLPDHTGILGKRPNFIPLDVEQLRPSELVQFVSARDAQASSRAGVLQAAVRTAADTMLKCQKGIHEGGLRSVRENRKWHVEIGDTIPISAKPPAEIGMVSLILRDF